MAESFLVAGVAVDRTVYHFDKLYDYALPQSMWDSAKEGCRVMIRFGNGSLRQGMILRLHREEDISGLKMIDELLDTEPVLSEDLVKLAFSMKERCFCTLFDACRAMLPAGLSLRVTYNYFLPKQPTPSELSALSETEMQIVAFLHQRNKPVREDIIMKHLGLSDDGVLAQLVKKKIIDRSETVKKRIQDQSVKMVTLREDDSSRRYTPAQQEVINTLRSVGDVSKKEISYFTGVSGAVIDNLVKKGICAYYDADPPVPEKSQDKAEDTSDITLIAGQERAYKELLAQYQSGKPCASLLYGITGSGKTSVFMKLIDQVKKDGRGIICMVPEIALTPQLLAKFTARYGDDVAVFHSGLSLSKRLEEWKRVKNGLAKIVVGTRSAVFAPLSDIGLIVMDEEQEYSYKSSANPRFHARELASIRCGYHRCLLLLSSATPSVESFYFATKGRYSLQTLNVRYGSAVLPKVIVADMNREAAFGNPSGFSSLLLEAIEQNLAKGQQSILLLNRRGHNTFVACRMCEEVLSCPNCSISLTYHSANHRLMCHYCGYSMPAPNKCPKCASPKLRYSGAGTQKAEQELQDIFPEAKLLRLDTDSTMQRYAYEKKLGAFRQGEYDIMLGTQMVAKGLDFPKVTLVGVLSADQMMHSDDFRSYERTFSLLTQVVGRSGRGDLEGRAIIQTYEPDHPIISLAAEQDYDAFFKSEIALRKAMLYPPFSDICVVAFSGEDRLLTQKASLYFAEKMSELARSEYANEPMRVIGPSPAVIARLNNRFRYRLIIKFKNNRRTRELFARLLTEFGKNRDFKDVAAYADIDPDSIL